MKGAERGQPITAKTLSLARSLLRSAFNWGVRLNIVGTNPVIATTHPKASAPEIVPFTPDEVARLYNASVDTRWGPFVVLAFETGARRGEILALRWTDVDFEKRQLRIAGSLGQTKGDGVYRKGTKTQHIRTIALSAGAVAALQRQRKSNSEDKLRAGGIYKDAGLIFPDELGRMRNPSAATMAFRKIAREAKLSQTSLHVARYTFVTRLLLAGIGVGTVALAGHRTPTITLKTYGHFVPAQDHGAVNILSDEIAQAVARSRAG